MSATITSKWQYEAASDVSPTAPSSSLGPRERAILDEAVRHVIEREQASVNRGMAYLRACDFESHFVSGCTLCAHNIRSEYRRLLQEGEG